MANLVKSLIIISLMAFITFGVARKALPSFLTLKEYRTWTRTWFVLILIAFIAHNIWLFFGLIVCYCLFVLPQASNVRIFYFLLMFSVLPLLGVEIPGLLGIRYIFKIDYVLLLILCLLSGLYVKTTSRQRWFTLKSDGFVMLYFVVVSYLSFRDDSFTNALRASTTIFLRFILLYYVVSRYLNDLDKLNKGLFALFIGIAPLATISIFESLWHWHVYDPFAQSLRGWAGLRGYDMRSGSLRATAIFGSPIVLGYVLVVGFGILLYTKPFIPNQRYANFAMAAIIAGLLATVARGPWVGLACLLYLYVWTGPKGASKVAGWTVLGFFSLPLLLMSSAGKAFLDLLPFVGSAQSDTVDYRAELVRQSWIVFKRNPWFGSTTYLDTPEMESMRQGMGIIDIVNTYAEIGLQYGVVGVMLFVLVFAGLLSRCYLILRRIPPAEADLLRMGRMLFATLTSMMLMIGTVSSIDFIPYFYWLFAGIVAAYLNVAEKTIEKKKVSLI